MWDIILINFAWNKTKDFIISSKALDFCDSPCVIATAHEFLRPICKFMNKVLTR